MGVEGAQVLALTIVVEAQDVAVEPHVAPPERRVALAQQRHRVHLGLGDEEAHRAAALDRQLGEVLLELEEALPRVAYLELDGYLLRLAIGIG